MFPSLGLTSIGSYVAKCKRSSPTSDLVGFDAVYDRGGAIFHRQVVLHLLLASELNTILSPICAIANKK